MQSLPPLKALQAFEAAARHSSFKAAAGELNVTPAAISQQIRGLEARIGRPLFRRGTREVALTETGLAAASVLKDAFQQLRAATRIMHAVPTDRVLTVSVAPSFCARWLVPRLHRFRTANPDRDLRLDATDAHADFRTGGIDVAIRYGRGRYAGLESVILRDDAFVPVCAPSYRDAYGPFRQPADLSRCTFIHLDWSLEPTASPDWGQWLARAGLQTVDGSRGPRFNADTMALQAAIDGHGVTLASRLVAEDDLRAGRLVRLFPDIPEEPAAFSLFLVYPPTREGDPRVAALLDWLRQELGSPTPRPSQVDRR